MATKKGESIEPVYKRTINYTKDGRVEIDDQRYVEISKNFADAVVKGMKNGSFYEDILSVNGVDYMREDKYEAYKALATALK